LASARPFLGATPAAAVARREHGVSRATIRALSAVAGTRKNDGQGARSTRSIARGGVIRTSSVPLALRLPVRIRHPLRGVVADVVTGGGAWCHPGSTTRLSSRRAPSQLALQATLWSIRW